MDAIRRLWAISPRDGCPYLIRSGEPGLERVGRSYRTGAGAKRGRARGCPSSDLAEHSAEPRLRAAQPVLNRAGGTGGQGGTAGKARARAGVAASGRAQGEVNARLGEAVIFGVEAARSARPAVTYQQRAVAQAGQVARAGGVHAREPSGAGGAGLRQARFASGTEDASLFDQYRRAQWSELTLMT